MGQQQADVRLCAPLSLSAVGYESVILIQESQPLMARQEEGGKEVGSCVFKIQ